MLLQPEIVCVIRGESRIVGVSYHKECMIQVGVKDSAGYKVGPRVKRLLLAVDENLRMLSVGEITSLE